MNFRCDGQFRWCGWCCNLRSALCCQCNLCMSCCRCPPPPFPTLCPPPCFPPLPSLGPCPPPTRIIHEQVLCPVPFPVYRGVPCYMPSCCSPCDYNGCCQPSTCATDLSTTCNPFPYDKKRPRWPCSKRYKYLKCN